jgi:hypothetical protein
MSSDLEIAVSNINDAATKANLTTDFFVSVLDGDKNTSVTNPVSGKSCPSLSKQINERFTEDSSQLNSLLSQATSQADRAKREADRASQISGLDTVSDAIALSAIPFPDVWIPFNESLRMISGYGREVMVGSDVVANMANYECATTSTYIDKSGVFHTSAINAARFERQGLLVDGQSTNLILQSNTYTFLNKFTDTGETTESPLKGEAAIVLAVNETGNSSNFVRFNTITSSSVSSARTSSCWVKPIGADMTISIDCEDIDQTSVLCKRDVWTRISTTRTTPIISSSVGFFDVSVVGPVAGQRLSVWGAQLEDLPLASSLIPTNGSTVTRAAGKLTIPRLNNECAEWYSGSSQITPIVSADQIEVVPPAGKIHLRNVRGFFTPLTTAQKAALK